MWIFVGYFFRQPIFGIQPDTIQIDSKETIDQAAIIQPEKPSEEKSSTKNVTTNSNFPFPIRPAEQTPNAQSDFKFRQSPQKQEAAVFNEQQLLQKARKAYWAGDKVNALKRYTEAMSHYPNSIDAIGEAGNLYYEMGDIDKALSLWKKMLPVLRSTGAEARYQQLKNLVQKVENQT